MKTLCDICLETKETRHFDLYISGSEGTRLCHGCEMRVVRFIREAARVALRDRKAAFMAKAEALRRVATELG